MDAPCGGWRPRRLATFAVTLAVAMVGAAPAAAETLTFTPVVDTYVDAALPGSAFGNAKSFWVDGRPEKTALIRFRLTGLNGRPVVAARLRLHQVDDAPVGGRVASVSSLTWSEDTTWDSRPIIDGAATPGFGQVAPSTWYETDVTSLVTGDGDLSLALDSDNADGARWSSRESANNPQLIVEVADSAAPLDGLSEVAPPTIGSSDATYYQMQHRQAVTSGGRLLLVYGRHAQGVQLAWRDPAGEWESATTGTVPGGLLLSGTLTGDWPASIAIERDSAGVEHAWVVWAGPYPTTNPRPLQMVRLNDLDAPTGPSVGPTMTVDPFPGGGFKPDIVFERAPSGAARGAILWSRKNTEGNTEVLVAWFTNLDTDTPAIHSQTTLLIGPNTSRFGTLVASSQGLRVAMRDASSRARLYRHALDDPLTSWSGGTTGMTLNYPSAVALASGRVLVATETTSQVVAVQRFSEEGAPAPVELQLTGYTEPTIAGDGTRAWLVMRRVADDALVSRELSPETGWSGEDRVEAEPTDGVAYTWPNAMSTTDDRLRLIMTRPAGSNKSSVIAFQRPLASEGSGDPGGGGDPGDGGDDPGDGGDDPGDGGEPPALLAHDTFSRIVTSGGTLGDPELGSGPWEISFGGGGAGLWSVDGQQALAQTSSVTTGQRMRAASDVDMMVRFQLGALASGGSIYTGLFARFRTFGGPQGDFVHMRVRNTNAGRFLVRLTREVGGATTSTAETDVVAATAAPDWYWMRFQVIEDTIRGKLWKAGTAEPDWLLTMSDPSIGQMTHTDAGIRQPGASGTSLPTIAYDDFSVR